jgi:adenylylsulfate kinase
MGALEGATIWLTGLPSAGKSTIARLLADRLAAQGRRVEVLDGDEVRAHLSPALGYSKEDRDANVRRIGYVAELLASNAVLVLAPVIAPYASSRAAVRERHRRSGTAYIEIHIATPVEVCAERDAKGLYARQAAGLVTGLTGVDDPYEAPVDPDARLDTSARTVEECAAEILELLASHGLSERPRVPRQTNSEASPGSL